MIRFCRGTCINDLGKGVFRVGPFCIDTARLFSLLLTSILLLSSASVVLAKESEFPADWYFDSMQTMREKLEGLPAPEISTDTWIGDTTTLDECRGKVVVLDFWATWCGPCVASIPKNISLVEEHSDDLVFIGMHSATSGWDKAEEMVDKRGINYPVVLDSGDTADDYQITGFPTYVIIDADGIVRAAGVLPTHVKDIVERLLEESGTPGNATQFTSLNRDWFYRGASWMRSWQDQLGQPAEPIRSAAWWMPGDGADEPESVDVADAEIDALAEVEMPEGYSELDLEGSVRVVHFTRPGLPVTDKQLELLNEKAAKYSPQGVVFLAVCDHESDWQVARSLATQLDLKMPLVLDRAIPSVADESNEAASETGSEAERESSEPTGVITTSPTEVTKPREAGETAQSYHIRIAPVTVLIDRKGRIRATGIRLDQLGDALDLLLSEQAG
ncbi:MAG: redoxin domain-containing protein [Planctomycetota bacterium]